MNEGEILYRYALLDETGKRISIEEARHLSEKHKFFCQDCGRPMYPTFGPVQAPHFRHKGKPCKPCHHLHTEAEYAFYEEYQYCLDNNRPFILDVEFIRPCNKACVINTDFNCLERKTRCRIDLTKIFTKASIEQTISVGDRTRRPDVLLSSDDGLCLWVEIWVSHTDASKKQLGNILEIKIDREEDIMPLREHRVDSFLGKASCDINDNVLLQTFMSNGTSDEEPVYPCDRFYYWEVYQSLNKKVLVRKFSDILPEKKPETLFLLVLMLNWSKRHDSHPENTYVGERFDMKRIKKFCEKKLLSSLQGGQGFTDHKLESLRRYDYAIEGFSLSDDELDRMLR